MFPRKGNAMVRKPKPTFLDRIIGFITATPATEVAAKRGHTEPTPRASMSGVKPVSVPRDSTYDRVPKADVDKYNTATATMSQLEQIILSVNTPAEVRHAAAERWAAIAPRPLRPHMPGIGHVHFWSAFREAYTESEVF